MESTFFKMREEYFDTNARGPRAQRQALWPRSSLGKSTGFHKLHMGFFSRLPTNVPSGIIFFFEALAVCSATHRLPPWVAAGRRVKRFGVLSDNTNTVSIFNSLRADPPYNPILISTIDVRIAYDIDMRVDYIPGKLNCVADALSRFDFERARCLDPSLTLFPFIPPRDALGAHLI
ncbi:hypothetical protein V8D89_013328 [Ganoderma adspersum]